VGDYIRDQLRQRFTGVNGVRSVRGRGLMIGIELDRPCKGIVETALAAGLLLNVTADTVIRLLPPLIFSRKDADHLLEIIIPLIQQVLATPQPVAA
jgi:acetylornithine aminotransferase